MSSPGPRGPLLLCPLTSTPGGCRADHAHDHAAKLLGVSRSKLYELLDAEIPSVHVGLLRRIRHADLEAYVAALTA